MLDRKLLLDAEQVFQEQPKLIELPSYGKGVFVGDTHGDLNATETVLGRYLHHKENTLVFLGDYVDRGEKSRENIDLLLRTKVDNPEQLYLLMGNHEAADILEFYPCDFWDSLEEKEREHYGRLLSKLPYAASGNGLLALHGAPPDLNPGKRENVNTLSKINKIKPGSDQWLRMTWGDLSYKDGWEFYVGKDKGRPMFGSDYFAKVMDDLNKEVLIRSHQPDAPRVMLNNRCLTIFTSHAYLPERTIAIADLGKETASVDDLEIRGV